MSPTLRTATISPPMPFVIEGVGVGHLSQLLADHLTQRQISERQAAERCGMRFESFRKILRGLIERPRDVTLQKISDGLGIPMARLVEARAKDANEQYVGLPVEDITTKGALQIAIAKAGEIPDEDLPGIRRDLEELMRTLQAEDKARRNE